MLQQFNSEKLWTCTCGTVEDWSALGVLNTYFQSYYTLTQYGGTTASKQSKCFEERRIKTGSYVIFSENRESVEESVELLYKGVPSTFMAGLSKVGKVPGAF